MSFRVSRCLMLAGNWGWSPIARGDERLGVAQKVSQCAVLHGLRADVLYKVLPPSTQILMFNATEKPEVESFVCRLPGHLWGRLPKCVVIPDGDVSNTGPIVCCCRNTRSQKQPHTKVSSVPGLYWTRLVHLTPHHATPPSMDGRWLHSGPRGFPIRSVVFNRFTHLSITHN